MRKTAQVLEYYRQKELEVFPHIPGMKELLNSYNTSTADLAKKYPDATFALMTASEIMSGNPEQNAINQEAYFEILRGKNIADIRSRYTKSMGKYMRDHRWDD